MAAVRRQRSDTAESDSSSTDDTSGSTTADDTSDSTTTDDTSDSADTSGRGRYRSVIH